MKRFVCVSGALCKGIVLWDAGNGSACTIFAARRVYVAPTN